MNNRDIEYPEPYRLFAAMAEYIPLDVLFAMPWIAGIDKERRNDDGSVTLLWSNYGERDYTIPIKLWLRLMDHMTDGNRRIDIRWERQGVVMDERGLPMTRRRWMLAIEDAISAYVPEDYKSG